jgi:hypothetical protein
MATGATVHTFDIELYAIGPGLIAALGSRLDGRMAFALSVSGRELFVSIGAETLTGRVARRKGKSCPSGIGCAPSRQPRLTPQPGGQLDPR